MQPESPVFASLNNVVKTFGAVRALTGADLEIRAGQVTAVVGHNGAGKSTLMQMLAGTIAPDSGTLKVDARAVASGYDVRTANALGVRCVFQELSLCPSLTAVENLLVNHRDLRGWGARRRAAAHMERMLETMYPGHAVDLFRPVGELPINQRQMIETARAFTETVHPVKLVILDEPTSSLDSEAAEKLMKFVGRAAERGVAILFVSHRLEEVLGHSHRIAVMKDGRTIGEGPVEEFSEARLVEMMGVVAGEAQGKRAGRTTTGAATQRVHVRDDRFAIDVNAGEIVGLAGLAGQGQREFLLKLFSAGARGRYSVTGTVAYVPGDRQTEGVFNLWSVGLNTAISAFGKISSRGFINLKREEDLAESWRVKLSVRAPDVDHPITSLSGGNQQKVLVARAFASGADVILLDDPLRGVDVSTKKELYEQIRAGAEVGQAFLWYTTELAELENCDRVYVFIDGSVSDVIPAAEYSEQRVIRSSFRDQAGHAAAQH
jgi:ribose transport system ATP-binding protein